MECLELIFLKSETFEFRCVNTEIWNVYVKCLEFENLKTKMSKLGCVNTSSWKLQIEMSEFGCVNTESWKLKIEIWNIFVNCLKGIWKFGNSEY
jgi:hypothetical protein